MSPSWGYRIRPLTPVEIEAYRRQRELVLERWPEARHLPGLCTQSPRCIEIATHETSYCYLRRPGYTSTPRRLACPKHAEVFATKHSLEVPLLAP